MSKLLSQTERQIDKQTRPLKHRRKAFKDRTWSAKLKSSVFVLVLRCMFRPPFTPTSKLFAHVFVYVSMVHIATLNFGGEGVCQQRTPPYMVSRLAKCCRHFSDVWNAAHTHFNFAFYVPLRVHVWCAPCTGCGVSGLMMAASRAIEGLMFRRSFNRQF